MISLMPLNLAVTGDLIGLTDFYSLSYEIHFGCYFRCFVLHQLAIHLRLSFFKLHWKMKEREWTNGTEETSTLKWLDRNMVWNEVSMLHFRCNCASLRREGVMNDPVAIYRLSFCSGSLLPVSGIEFNNFCCRKIHSGKMLRIVKMLSKRWKKQLRG